MISRRNFLQAALPVFAITLLSCDRKTPGDDKFRITAGATPRTEKLRTGVIPEPTMKNLLGAIAPSLGLPYREENYKAHFAWKAEKRPGYLYAYTQFSDAADQLAMHLHGAKFAGGTDAQRHDVVNALANTVRNDVAVDKEIRQSVRSFIVHEIHLMYARTDAWTALGYEGWPGSARGLDRYTLPPPDRS